LSDESAYAQDVSGIANFAIICCTTKTVPRIVNRLTDFSRDV